MTVSRTSLWRTAVCLAVICYATDAWAHCAGRTCVRDIGEVSVVPDANGMNATEVCPVTSDFGGSQNGMVSNFDLFGADLGISVVDPVAGSDRTFVFFGDTVGADPVAWGGGADFTGYFANGDLGQLCQGFQATTMPGLTSAYGGQVFAPDVLVSPPWATIGEFVGQPTLPPAGQSLAPNAGVPGGFEVPTGAFADSERQGIYIFYMTNTAPPGAANPNISASHVVLWERPLVTQSQLEPRSPNTYRILAHVDHLFSPDYPNLGGHFINVSPVAGDDGHLYLFGTGAYRASDVYLARMPLENVALIGTRQHHFLATIPGFEVWSKSLRTGKDKWSPPEHVFRQVDPLATALPLTTNGHFGELSVKYVREAGLWLMMPTGALIRWALSPTGPWSGIQVLIPADSATEQMYCCQGRKVGPDPGQPTLPFFACLGPPEIPVQQIAECDGLSSKACGSERCGVPGYFRSGMYGPYMLPHPTVHVSYRDAGARGLLLQTDTITVPFLLSNFDPYGSSFFSVTLKAEMPIPAPEGGHRDRD